jgi:hypothetical protein
VASGGWEKDIEGRAARNQDEQPWYRENERSVIKRMKSEGRGG